MESSFWLSSSLSFWVDFSDSSMDSLFFLSDFCFFLGLIHFFLFFNGLSLLLLFLQFFDLRFDFVVLGEDSVGFRVHSLVGGYLLFGGIRLASAARCRRTRLKKQSSTPKTLNLANSENKRFFRDGTASDCGRRNPIKAEDRRLVFWRPKVLLPPNRPRC